MREEFADCEARLISLLRRRFGHAEFRPGPDRCGVGPALARYFAGEVHAIDALQIAPGGRAFQQLAWHALRTIGITDQRYGFTQLMSRF